MDARGCPRCGHRTGEPASFCPACGTRLGGPPRALRRRRAGGTLAGVCSGLAEYFDVDPTLVRVAYLSATVLSGLFPGVILYLVLALFIPAD
ncbi:MAG: PspC domain-containing protein [Acidobacteriota bacterium]